MPKDHNPTTGRRTLPTSARGQRRPAAPPPSPALLIPPELLARVEVMDAGDALNLVSACPCPGVDSGCPTCGPAMRLHDAIREAEDAHHHRLREEVCRRRLGAFAQGLAGELAAAASAQSWETVRQLVAHLEAQAREATAPPVDLEAQEALAQEAERAARVGLAKALLQERPQ